MPHGITTASPSVKLWATSILLTMGGWGIGS